MESLCLSSTVCLFTHNNNNNNNNKRFLSLKNQSPLHNFSINSKLTTPLSLSSNIPFKFCIKSSDCNMLKRKGRGFGAVCSAVPISARNLQWISTVSSVVLMLSKGTAVHKTFLVPLFALQAPTSVISWIKGDYGVWTAFLAVLVRLFFFFPGELELPFMALLMVILAPYQVINLRVTKEGAIISLVIAGYLAFQHFSRTGTVLRSFEQGSIVATLCIICITIVSCLLLI